MSSKKKRRNDNHVIKTVSIQKDLYEKFKEIYPDVNLSFFIELCMQEALKLAGISILLEEDKIILNKAKTTIDKLEKILKTKEIVDRLRIYTNLKRAKIESDLYKSYVLKNDTE